MPTRQWCAFAFTEDGGDALRERLREHTGQKSVPFVFIGGRFVAAQQAMEGMRGPTPALKATLEASRANRPRA